MRKFLFVLFILALLLVVSCCDSGTSAQDTKGQSLSETELMEKYGPKELTEGQVDSIIESIEWTTNESPSILGSKEAKKGGTLRLGSALYPTNLRAYGPNSNYVINHYINQIVHETLLRIDPVTLEYLPGLADKWFVTDDKKTFFFHIDERARWQDGKLVTAFDIVATWDFLLDDGLKDPFVQDIMKNFERPVALKKNIVMVKPKSIGWQEFLNFSVLEIFVLPQHILKDLTHEQYLRNFNDKLLLGSGPYEFGEATPNQNIILKRNPNWWGADLPINRGLYNFDRIEYIFYTDETILYEKFKKGDIDLIYVRVARNWVRDFVPEKISAIKNNHIIKQKVFTNAPQGLSGYYFNLREEPFDDIRVRKALCMLFNRETMIEKLFFHEYKFQDSHFPNSPYENKNNPKIRYNPTEAIKILEEAGYSQKNLNDEGYLVKDGKVFEFDLNVVSSGDSRVETLFQEELKKVGIKVNLKKVTWAQHIKDLDERNFKVIGGIQFTSTPFPPPEEHYHSKFADKKNTNNIWGFKNKRVDQICEEYNKEYDLKKRIKLIQELDSIVTNQYTTILYFYSNNVRILYWNKFGMPDFVFPGVFYDGRVTNREVQSSIAYWWYDGEADKRLKEAIENDLPLPAKPAEVRYWEKYR
jgi:microcin C transport system substrate-binding protein